MVLHFPLPSDTDVVLCVWRMQTFVFVLWYLSQFLTCLHHLHDFRLSKLTEYFYRLLNLTEWFWRAYCAACGVVFAQWIWCSYVYILSILYLMISSSDNGQSSFDLIKSPALSDCQNKDLLKYQIRFTSVRDT